MVEYFIGAAILGVALFSGKSRSDNEHDDYNNRVKRMKEFNLLYKDMDRGIARAKLRQNMKFGRRH